MGRACSGCGSGAMTNVEPQRGRVIDCGDGLPDTLLGFETTGLFFLAPVWGGRRVVALLWWWGVVFDLWIVVASISQWIAHRPFGVGGWFVVSVNAIF